MFFFDTLFQLERSVRWYIIRSKFRNDQSLQLSEGSYRLFGEVGGKIKLPPADY